MDSPMGVGGCNGGWLTIAKWGQIPPVALYWLPVATPLYLAA